MALYSGSYENLLKGVTSKASTLSADFVAEQENFIPNPHYGLVRRGGSKRVGTGAPVASIEDDNVDDATFGLCEFTKDGIDYCLVYPKGTADTSVGAWLINKSTNAVSSVNISDSAKTYGGFTAATVYGDELLLVNKQPVVYTTRDQLTDSLPQMVAAPPAWPKGFFTVAIKGGKYKAKYKITVTRHYRNASGDSLGVYVLPMEYTTKPAQYDGLLTLDTSAILASDPEYQKKVTDIINSYNTAVNAHTLAAGLDILTENIAQKLSDSAVAAGFIHNRGYAFGSYVTIPKVFTFPDGSYYDVPTSVEVTVDDTYSPHLLVDTYNEFNSTADFPKDGIVGEVVQVGLGDKAQFFAAIAQGVDYTHGGVIDSLSMSTGRPYPVYWKEVARYVYTVTESPFSRGYWSSPSTFTIASHDLTTIPLAGDAKFSPVPNWYTQPIDYVGVVQNRLLVVCNGTFYFSEVGTENFFVKSVSNLAPSDAISVTLLNGSGAKLKESVNLEQYRLFFDGKNVYSLDTRSVITPTNINITLQGKADLTVGCAPVNYLDTVFIAADNGDFSEVSALNTGDFASSVTTESVSSHVDNYIQGQPASMAYIPRNKTLVVKTGINGQTLYGCTLLPSSSGVNPSWFRLSMSSLHGKFIGMYVHKSKLYLLWLRKCGESTDVYSLVVDELDLADPSPSVYIDSYRPATFDYVNDHIYEYDIPAIGTSNQTAYVSFYDDSSYMGLISSGITGVTDEVTAFLADCYAGFMYTASVTPNSPRIKDSNDKSIVSGRLVISNVKVETANTVAMGQAISGYSTSYLARYTGNSEGFGALVSKYTPTDRTVTVFIGRETREYNLTLSSITWLPLTITNIEWNGQLWSNRRPTKGG